MFKLIKKNWPLFGIALLVLTVVFYLGRSRREVVPTPNLPGEAAEGVRLENIQLTHESAGEGVRWSLDAKEVKISDNREQISFTDFSLKLEPLNREPIHLEGKAGRYDKTAGRLLLSGDLRGRTGDGYTISTEKAMFCQKEGKLTTDEAVLITGPFLSLEGRGLTYDVASEVLEIKSKVKTEINGRLWVS